MHSHLVVTFAFYLLPAIPLSCISVSVNTEWTCQTSAGFYQSMLSGQIGQHRHQGICQPHPVLFPLWLQQLAVQETSLPEQKSSPFPLECSQGLLAWGSSPRGFPFIAVCKRLCDFFFLNVFIDVKMLVQKQD